MKKINKILPILIVVVLAVALLFVPAANTATAAAPVQSVRYDFANEYSNTTGTSILTHISGSDSISLFNTANQATQYSDYAIRPYITQDTSNTYGYGSGAQFLGLTGSGTQTAGAHLKASAVMIDFQHPTGKDYPVTGFQGTSSLTTAQSWKENIVQGGTSFVIGKTTDTVNGVSVTKYLYTTLGVFDELHTEFNKDGSISAQHGSQDFLIGFGNKGVITIDNSSQKPERSPNSTITGGTKSQFNAEQFAEYVTTDNGSALSKNQKSALINYLKSLSDDNINISAVGNFIDFTVRTTKDGAKFEIAFNNMPGYSSQMPLSATDATLVDMPEKIRFNYTVDYTYAGVTYEPYIGAMGLAFGANGNINKALGMDMLVIREVSLVFDTSSYIEIDSSTFAPEVLGAKILKGSNPEIAQRLRIDVDFSKIVNAKEKGVEIVEYGVIYKEGSYLDGDFTKEELILNGSKLAKGWKSSDDAPENLKIAVNRPPESYGKRISVVAYLKDVNGEYFYSFNNSADADITNGIADKSVMGVMKSVMKENITDNAQGYSQAIAKYLASDSYTYGSAYDEVSIKAITDDYINGVIGTNHADYNIAKEFLGYIFYFYNGED